ATGGPQAQDLSLLLGKMLRLDVDGASPYAVPADNPFVGDPTAREEIWAWGFRNPYRWSFDRGTGDLLIGDVGEGSWEEVDFQPAASAGGENYGWPCREGAHDFDPDYPTCDGALVDPVLEFAHGPACAVIGGYVYRGAIAGLVGTYVYTDWCTGTTWFAAEIAPGVWQSQEWGTLPPFSVIGFGEDEAGELYVTLGDAIGRFHSPSSASLIFADGFESGELSSWSSASP
ncbi:MAG: PQQ-dependent sugar dehydrogenase, partial [Thermoanaerobaculia bacterium]